MYDGLTLKNYAEDDVNSNILAGVNITKIIEDEEGKCLWIATIGRGLIKYVWENDSFINYKHQQDKKNTLASNDINTIALDNNGNIITGFRRGGLNIFDPENEVFTNLVPDNSLNNSKLWDISELKVDESNRVWIATWNNGLFFIDLNHRTFTAQQVHLHNDEEMHYPLTALYIDKDNIVWAGNRNGSLFKIEHDTKQLNNVQLENNNNSSELHINDIIEIENKLLIATSSGPYTIQDKTILKPEIQRLSKIEESLLICLFEDSFENIWIGTNNGIKKLKKKKFKEKTYFNEGKPVNITSLTIGNKNTIYIGTWGNGLFSCSSDYLIQSGRILQLNTLGSLESKRIYDQLYLKNNLLLGLYNSGLVKLTTKSSSIEMNYAEQIKRKKVTELLQLNDNNILVGTQDGLYLCDINGQVEQELKHIQDKDNSLSDNQITALYRSHDKRIWVGTALGGLNQMIYNDTISEIRFKQFKTKYGKFELNSEYITVIAEDKKQNIWIGTHNRGVKKLIEYVKPGKNKADSTYFISYSEKDGLIENVVTAILTDKKNNLWISGKNSISILNVNTNKITGYSENDGLSLKNFCSQNASLQLKNGWMILGGNAGFITFHPDSLRKMKPPKIYIRDLKVINTTEETANQETIKKYLHNKPVWKANKITFPPDVKSFSFELIAIDLYNPKKVVYYYMLEGFDKEWIKLEKGNRIATYTNIDPGEYTFRFTATNSDGISCATDRKIKIEIHPPFWQTKWAILLYLVIAIVIYLIIRKMMVYKISLENEVKLERLSHEKDNELHQHKLRFFTDISHELRTPLTLVIGPVEKLITKFSDHKILQEELQLVHRNARRLMNLAEQVIDIRRHDAGHLHYQPQMKNIVETINDISKSFVSIAKDKKINFSYISRFEQYELQFDVDKLEKVITNLLSNAFKYTPQHGSIVIELFKNSPVNIPTQLIEYKILNEKDDIKIAVYNSGNVIPKDELNDLFQRFFRGEKEKLKVSGAGIGLSIVKDLVEIQNGKIEVESIPDIGTCFTVILPNIITNNNLPLPASDSETDKQQTVWNKYYVNDNNTPERIHKPDSEKPENQQQTSLVIIEDDKDLLKFISSIFQNEYKISLFTTGEEGLIFTLNEIPDLIISDVMLPGIDGKELCKRLKTDIRTSHIPVILLTALSDIENQIDGIEYGADAYITKPFNVNYLIVRVKKLIEIRRHFFKKFSTELSTSTMQVSKNKLDDDFLKRLTGFIHQNLSNSDLKIEDLSDELKMSRVHMFRKIKSLTNLSPSEFVSTVRIKHAAKRLLEEEASISEIAYTTGFNSPNYFSVCFKKQFGLSPREFIHKNKTSIQ